MEQTERDGIFKAEYIDFNQLLVWFFKGSSHNLLSLRVLIPLLDMLL